jgi:sarcosine oxidase delta subunit
MLYTVFRWLNRGRFAEKIILISGCQRGMAIGRSTNTKFIRVGAEFGLKNQTLLL